MLKIFNRYQQVQGKKVSDVLIEKGIQLGVKMISYIIPIEDSKKLERDLSQDQLVNRELSNMIGLIVLRGGRFVALASGLIQVANNISIGETNNKTYEKHEKINLGKIEKRKTHIEDEIEKNIIEFENEKIVDNKL